MRAIVFIILTFCVLWNFVPVFAQIDRFNSEWMRYLEDLAAEEETDNETLADWYDELSYIVEHPYNLHTVSREELEKLPFLTALQVENLLYYIYKYAPLVDISELKNVEDLDLQTITYLLPFVYVGDTKQAVARTSTRHPLSALRYSRQELMLRANFTVQEKAGYAQGKYPGDPFFLNFRYGFNYQDRILLGISEAKDPGERIWDYAAFNLVFKDMGMLEALHFGNYRLSFGQGLVMNTNFSMGKTSGAIQINQRNTGILRHVSANESRYFSGTAGCWRRENVRITLFYSDRNHDATADDTTVYAFKTDGYHRTYSDWLKQRAVRVILYGGNVQWQNSRYSLGLTTVYYTLNGKNLNPELKPYNLFYLRGKAYGNTGLNYTYKAKKMNFQGETAVDYSGKIASIGNWLFRPASFLDWVCSFRYYDKQYNALYAGGFSESTLIQNEMGIYSGLKLRLLQRWELSAYLDRFVFPWLKYGIDTPSSGKDVLTQLKYNLHPDCLMELRYRLKDKYAGNEPYKQHRGRYRLKYSFNKHVQFDTQVDYNRYISIKKNQQGWSLTQSFTYRPAVPFQLDGGLAYFHTGDWNTRISVYEKNVLYAFSFPAYYGRGWRYYAVMKWKITPAITVYLKCGSSHYFDRESIGSGAEEIQGREKTDVYCLVRWSL